MKLAFIFWLQIWNNANKNETKKKHKTKSEVKNELARSIQGCEVVENEELNQMAQTVTNHEQAISIVKDYELIIRSKNKGILTVGYKQGVLFKKFKDSKNFEQVLKET